MNVKMKTNFSLLIIVGVLLLSPACSIVDAGLFGGQGEIVGDLAGDISDSTVNEGECAGLTPEECANLGTHQYIYFYSTTAQQTICNQGLNIQDNSPVSFDFSPADNQVTYKDDFEQIPLRRLELNVYRLDILMVGFVQFSFNLNGFDFIVLNSDEGACIRNAILND